MFVLVYSVFMLPVLKSHESLTFKCISWKFWMVSQRAVFFVGFLVQAQAQATSSGSC